MKAEKSRRNNYMNDSELISAVAAGDHIAKRKLVERLLDKTRRTVSYLVAADRDADDMTQLSLIEILRSAGSFRGECSLEFFAQRITVRTVMRELRRRRRRTEVEQEIETSPPPSSSVEDEFVITEVRTRLTQLLEKLTPERRAAVVLHHVEQYSIKEVAELTGARVNTVRDRLRVGRNHMRKWITADPLLKSRLVSRFK